MKKEKLTIEWQGTFIELCIGRVSGSQIARLDAALSASGEDIQSLWYDNKFLLKSLFNADNWWSVDDLDHSMGLVFADRSALDSKLATMHYRVNGVPVTVDPDALQLSFYAPEIIDVPLDIDDRMVCHGTRRQTMLHLAADIDPPFDPSLITLSLITYPDYGTILIDLDYDGHDEVQFTWGDTTYLEPSLFEKDHFHDTSR